jgi:hypothetical protein
MTAVICSAVFLFQCAWTDCGSRAGQAGRFLQCISLSSATPGAVAATAAKNDRFIGRAIRVHVMFQPNQAFPIYHACVLFFFVIKQTMSESLRANAFARTAATAQGQTQLLLGKTRREAQL